MYGLPLTPDQTDDHTLVIFPYDASNWRNGVYEENQYRKIIMTDSNETNFESMEKNVFFLEEIHFPLSLNCLNFKVMA